MTTATSGEGRSGGDVVLSPIGDAVFFTCGQRGLAMRGSPVPLDTPLIESLNAVLAFWLAYILTRSLGASIGDLLSQPRSSGDLGLGTTVTSFAFFAAVLVVSFS